MSISAARAELHRPTGRRPGENQTRHDILAAARAQFAQKGFAGATLRAIAQAAGVDTALIHHYFASKEGMFAAAIEESFDSGRFLTDVGDSPARIATSIVTRYFDLWESAESQQPLMAIMRSAIENDRARQILLNFMSNEIYDVLAPILGQDEARLRISFVGSQLLGAAMLRYIIRLEPLASMDCAQLVAVLSTTVERYIGEDLPSRPAA